MAYQITGGVWGSTAYDVLGDAAERVGRAVIALRNVTAAQPLSFLEIIMPPLAWLKAGGQLSADLKTSAGRTATMNRLGDLEMALVDASTAATNLGDQPIGDANAAKWQALLNSADGIGQAVQGELARVASAASPTNTIAGAPGDALESLGLGGATAVRGVGQGAGAAVGAVGWLGRNLPWLLLGAGVVGVVALFVFKLPQRWITRRRKG